MAGVKTAQIALSVSLLAASVLLAGCPTRDLSSAVDFGADVTSGPAPLTVKFTNNSADIVYGDDLEHTWSFGDHHTSHEANPSHTYEAPGSYTVSLKMTSASGEGTKAVPDYITVGEPDGLPLPLFDLEHWTGPAPLTVVFIDMSRANGSPIVKWHWTFGENNASSDERNTQHTYTTPGTYDMTFTVTSQSGKVGFAEWKGRIKVLPPES